MLLQGPFSCATSFDIIEEDRHVSLQMILQISSVRTELISKDTESKEDWGASFIDDHALLEDLDFPSFFVHTDVHRTFARQDLAAGTSAEILPYPASFDRPGERIGMYLCR